jgi:hypothetical protein
LRSILEEELKFYKLIDEKLEKLEEDKEDQEEK